MQVITFYSYKGGVGRTLVVANVAKYLARFGQKVFALDFDLEAPGLHYKFGFGTQPGGTPVRQGVLDYIHSFVTTGQPPPSLKNYVLQLNDSKDSEGVIWLMPAGNAPSAAYWHRLARISWHELFYSSGAKGIPFFLEFKQLIEKEFSPDFLLIDSRTGITEIGGIATTVLPDKVVCLLMNNPENLDGAREVLRSVRRADRLPGQAPIEILPVVARIPQTEAEADILDRIRGFLNEEAADLPATLDVPEVFVLHSDRDLEVSEALRIGGAERAEESLLLRDYLRLFVRLVPRDIIESRITPLVDGVMRTILDAPDLTQQNIEALAEFYPHPECQLALLKLYRLRRVGPKALLSAADKYWQLTSRADDAVLWELLHDNFPDYARSPERGPPCALQFAEAVWRACGLEDVQFAVRLAEWYVRLDEPRRAARVFEECIARNGPTPEVVPKYLEVLAGCGSWAAAYDLIECSRAKLGQSIDFLRAWARLLLQTRERSKIVEFLEGHGSRFEKLEEGTIGLYARLLLTIGRNEEAAGAASQWLGDAIRRGAPERLVEVGTVFSTLGRFEEFEAKVREAFPEEVADDIFRGVRPRRGRIR